MQYDFVIRNIPKGKIDRMVNIHRIYANTWIQQLEWHAFVGADRNAGAFVRK